MLQLSRAPRVEGNAAKSPLPYLDDIEVKVSGERVGSGRGRKGQ